MPRNYFVQLRQQVKVELLQFIKDHTDLTLDEILGRFSIQTGYRVTTLETYVEELQKAGYLKEYKIK